MSISPARTVPRYLHDLVDDAAIFPPGNLELDRAVTAHAEHRDAWYAPLVGPFVVSDRALPRLVETLGDAGQPLPISVVVTGGAGAIGPALGFAAGQDRLDVRAIEIALRDPAAPAENAQRVTTVLDMELPEGATAYVEMPRLDDPGRPARSWLDAADVVAASDRRLKFRTGGESPEAHPTATELSTSIDAALERELPFKCTAGLHHAVRRTSAEGYEQHGFLNVLLATRALFDGASVAEAADLLEQRQGEALTRALGELDETARAGARRWFRSFGSCSIIEPVDDLTALELTSKETA